MTPTNSDFGTKNDKTPISVVSNFRLFFVMYFFLPERFSHWLYVDDHCAGILLVLQRGRLGEAYNIGGGNEQTNIDLVDLLCDLLERLHPTNDNSALAGSGIAELLEKK